MNVESGVCCCYGTAIGDTVVVKKASGKLWYNRSGLSAVWNDLYWVESRGIDMLCYLGYHRVRCCSELPMSLLWD